jgi:hypothetical protein
MFIERYKDVLTASFEIRHPGALISKWARIYVLRIGAIITRNAAKAIGLMAISLPPPSPQSLSPLFYHQPGN